MSTLVFDEDWGDENQQEILKLLGISSPEETKVKEVVIERKDFSITFWPEEGKYWSMAFVEAAFHDLELDFGSKISIPDSLKQLTENCFSGLPCHFGFVLALAEGKTIEVKLG